MRSKSSIFNYCWYITYFAFISITFSLVSLPSHASSSVGEEKSSQVNLNRIKLNLSNSLSGFKAESARAIASSIPVLPETKNLVKKFEGFRSYAYIDSSGLPVVGYGQSRINGRTVTMGQYISQEQANIALEQELYQIQKLVLAQIKVDLNPHQLGALTSLVYNAGTAAITNSTLARKLNAGDYLGAAQQFVRWNKANRGGQLVVFPGLTRRRLAEKQLFLTPYNNLASNN